jgi:hypothetical protein
MVVFYSYVSLPEGMSRDQVWWFGWNGKIWEAT